MRLVITYDPAQDDLFVQGEWTSVHGVHGKRLTEDMPVPIRTAARDVIDWAQAQETGLRQGIERVNELQEIERDIARLNARRQQLRGG